jgi:hypothetical protein
MAASIVVATGIGSVSPHAAAAAKEARAAMGDIHLRPAAQVTRNDRADVTFELRPAASGGISVIARSGDLTATKTVQPTGDFVLELAAGQDRLSIAASAQGVVVTRGRTSVALRRDDQPEEAEVKARTLLAASGSLVRFRAVAARLMEEQDRSAGALGLILADATVGLLSGDVGAPRRVARFLVERRLRNVREAGMALDCFTLMETRFVEAWNDYGSCYMSTEYNSFYQYLCSWRWTVQVESYWFNFLSCTGFNIN